MQKDADIVIEAIPEVVSIKTDFYKQLGESAPEKQFSQQILQHLRQVNLKMLQVDQKNS